MPRNPSPGSTTARGYGHRHQQIRRAVAAVVASGNAVCARCGEQIVPGQRWDLGHVDGDKTRYSGPEHASCNRATSTHRQEGTPEAVEPR